MSLTVIIVLILLGLLLIVFEFLVLPGTNISGIVGILFILSGIYFAYKDLGVPVAHYVLAGGFFIILITSILILRSNTWQRISLKATVDGKVENVEAKTINIGDTGKTLTRLAPMGTVLVNDKTFEGKSGHKFIDPNTPIEVTKVEGNQLIVKPID